MRDALEAVAALLSRVGVALQATSSVTLLAGMLVLAHRPFPAPQPYAEIGPIFLCADACAAGGGEAVPEILVSSDYIVRGYGADDRIVYGTGGVVATGAIPARAAELFGDPRVAYVHVRSARNNCYQVRIDR